MKLCIVGAERTSLLERFERYAQDQGCASAFALLDQQPDALQFDGGGVILFDEGTGNLVDWLGQVRAHNRYVHVPVVAVTPAPAPDNQRRLLAAGVQAVCDANAGFAPILAALRQHCDGVAVQADIRQQLLEPFISATFVSTRELAGTEVAVRAVYQKTSYRMFGDISAVIGFMAPQEGAMVMSFPEATAQHLVSRLLAGVTDSPDSDMVRDGVGELANVIAGQAKGLLSGTAYHFSFSTPTIVGGAGHEIRHKQGVPCLVVAFDSDAGSFALQLCLKG